MKLHWALRPRSDGSLPRVTTMRRPLESQRRRVQHQQQVARPSVGSMTQNQPQRMQRRQPLGQPSLAWTPRQQLLAPARTCGPRLLRRRGAKGMKEFEGGATRLGRAAPTTCGQPQFEGQTTGLGRSRTMGTDSALLSGSSISEIGTCVLHSSIMRRGLAASATAHRA